MSFGDLERLVYQGNVEGLQAYLDDHDDTPIETTYEPYTLLQKKKQAEALTLLMNDPRFVFDDLFVSRMFYFSTGLIHETVWRHPKMKHILEGAESMSEYFYRRYPKPTWSQSAGLGNRFFQADNVILYLKRQDAKRVLRRFSRQWLAKTKTTLENAIQSG
jgi:hypothetical protein